VHQKEFEVKMKIFMTISMILAMHLSATIINIPGDYLTIQSGIDAAADADTVLVETGTYVENINFDGKSITVASYYIIIQDSFYIEQTIIDGDQNGSVVVFDNNEDTSSVLTGFSIVHGNGTYCNPASLGNFYWGGGIFCLNSGPTLTNLNIWENQSDIGGGISLINSNPTLDNLVISNNHTSLLGAGLSCGLSSNPEMKNLKIIGNIANNGPGGLHFFYDSNPIVMNSIIRGNISQSSYASGGGISCVSASPTFISVKVTENSASSGGGIDLGDSNAILENVQITNNHSYNSGPGLCIADSNPVIINSTISDNTSDGFSANIFCIDNVNLTLINTISWSNLLWEIGFYWDYAPNTVHIVNSNIKNGINGINTNNNGILNWLDRNIDLNPVFANQSEFDFHLQDNSPCIGAGIDEITVNGTTYYTPQFDFEGNPRPSPEGSMPDMGAYENPFGQPQVSLDNFEFPKQKNNLTNFPNPFNPTTTIQFSLQTNSKINLSIYNIKGQRIKTLIHNAFAKGSHSIIWNGNDENDKPVSSGIYYYKLNVNGKTKAIKKCLLLK
jgi:FlgD Ig-like domain